MSPLIATVLLIAFAVALGAMIMNWSSGIEADSSSGVDCAGVAISLQDAVCAVENELTIGIRNSGSTRVDGLEVVLLNPAQNLDLSLRIKDSSLIPGEEGVRTVTAVVPNLDTQLEINPLILDDSGKLAACPSKGLTQDRLISC